MWHGPDRAALTSAAVPARDGGFDGPASRCPGVPESSRRRSPPAPWHPDAPRAASSSTALAFAWTVLVAWRPSIPVSLASSSALLPPSILAPCCFEGSWVKRSLAHWPARQCLPWMAAVFGCPGSPVHCWPQVGCCSAAPRAARSKHSLAQWPLKSSQLAAPSSRKKAWANTGLVETNCNPERHCWRHFALLLPMCCFLASPAVARERSWHRLLMR